MYKRIIIPFALFLFVIQIFQPVSCQLTGNNSVMLNELKPAELYYPAGRKIKLQKLDLNKASLQQIMALPQVNEDMAIKIMRRRPIRSLEDLYNLPYLNVDRVKTIVDSMANLVLQQHKQGDELKQ